ncbi:hypothetical protein ACQJBY_073094 [Aegilops geniculata]
MAARQWVRWEEEILLEDDDEHHTECFYLRCAPLLGGVVSERDLAVVGKYCPDPAPGNMVYSADQQFLRFLQEGITCDSVLAMGATVRVEITQLSWKSGKEVMDWLNLLVTESSGQTSNGGAANPVNSVPVQEICITNEQAPVPAIDEQQVIDLTMCND